MQVNQPAALNQSRWSYSAKCKAFKVTLPCQFRRVQIYIIITHEPDRTSSGHKSHPVQGLRAIDPILWRLRAPTTPIKAFSVVQKCSGVAINAVTIQVEHRINIFRFIGCPPPTPARLRPIPMYPAWTVVLISLLGQLLARSMRGPRSTTKRTRVGRTTTAFTRHLSLPHSIGWRSRSSS